MAADLYRDAQVGIRARLAELEANIREREAEVTQAFWSSLDDHVRERLATLRAGIDHVASDSFDQLARAEGSLAAYLEELERLIASLPALEEEWRSIPDDVADPPVHVSGGSHVSSSEGHAFVKTFRAAVRSGDRDAEIVVERGWSCLARFRQRDAPFSLRATALTNGNGQVSDVVMQLVTSIARATPALLVRHESLFAAVSKAIGWKHAVEVGDASFDGLFLIQGTRDAAHRFLVPNVRSLLMSIARFDVPTLVLDPPSRIASLTWCFEPAASALGAAVRVLSFVHDVQSEVHFRKS
jgi:hypothetical protein